MIVEPQTVSLRVNKNNQGYYICKGYNFDNGNTILINVMDLIEGSSAKVECICDYCGQRMIKPYNKIIRGRKVVKRDCCNNTDCLNRKKEEICVLKYGVSHVSQLESTIKQRKETCLLKYGYEHATQSEFVKNKTRATNMDKYGVPYVMQSQEMIDRSKETSIKKYGVDHHTKADSVKEKHKQTMLKKYGVTNYAKTKEYKEKMISKCLSRYGVKYFPQVEELKRKARETNLKKLGVEYPMQSIDVRKKSKNSFYKNKNGVCSKQQYYISQIIGGEVNFPVEDFSLDIAFPEKKIYVEYDGGGHDLCVKLGSMTEKEFKTKEIKRFLYLRSRGWKLIKIVSKKDYLPSETKIKQLIELSISFFKNSKRTWITFDIDQETLMFKNNAFHYEYGELQKLGAV